MTFGTTRFSRLRSCFLFFSGDIKDLYNIKLKAGHAAAFATDCDLPLSHEMVRSIGMQVNFYGFYYTMQTDQLLMNFLLVTKYIWVHSLDHIHGLPGL